MLERRHRPGAATAAALTLALIAGCTPPPGEAPGGPPPRPAPTGDALRVEAGRAVVFPGGTGAAYFEILNPTAEDDALLAVATAVARAAEVHETLDDGGVLRMRAFPEGLPVPAHTTVVLEPGGKHVMLLALERELEPGEEIELELTFERAGALRVTVPVREGAG